MNTGIFSHLNYDTKLINIENEIDKNYTYYTHILNSRDIISNLNLSSYNSKHIDEISEDERKLNTISLTLEDCPYYLGRFEDMSMYDEGGDLKKFGWRDYKDKYISKAIGRYSDIWLPVENSIQTELNYFITSIYNTLNYSVHDESTIIGTKLNYNKLTDFIELIESLNTEDIEDKTANYYKYLPFVKYVYNFKDIFKENKIHYTDKYLLSSMESELDYLHNLTNFTNHITDINKVLGTKSMINMYSNLIGENLLLVPTIDLQSINFNYNYIMKLYRNIVCNGNLNNIISIIHRAFITEENNFNFSRYNLQYIRSVQEQLHNNLFTPLYFKDGVLKKSKLKYLLNKTSLPYVNLNSLQNINFNYYTTLEDLQSFIVYDTQKDKDRFIIYDDEELKLLYDKGISNKEEITNTLNNSLEIVNLSHYSLLFNTLPSHWYEQNDNLYYYTSSYLNFHSENIINNLPPINNIEVGIGYNGILKNYDNVQYGLGYILQCGDNQNYRFEKGKDTNIINLLVYLIEFTKKGIIKKSLTSIINTDTGEGILPFVYNDITENMIIDNRNPLSLLTWKARGYKTVQFSYCNSSLNFEDKDKIYSSVFPNVYTEEDKVNFISYIKFNDVEIPLFNFGVFGTENISKDFELFKLSINDLNTNNKIKNIGTPVSQFEYVKGNDNLYFIDNKDNINPYLLNCVNNPYLSSSKFGFEDDNTYEQKEYNKLDDYITTFYLQKFKPEILIDNKVKAEYILNNIYKPKAIIINDNRKITDLIDEKGDIEFLNDEIDERNTNITEKQNYYAVLPTDEYKIGDNTYTGLKITPKRLRNKSLGLNYANIGEGYYIDISKATGEKREEVKNTHINSHIFKKDTTDEFDNNTILKEWIINSPFYFTDERDNSQGFTFKIRGKINNSNKTEQRVLFQRPLYLTSEEIDKKDFRLDKSLCGLIGYNEDTKTNYIKLTIPYCFSKDKIYTYDCLLKDINFNETNIETDLQLMMSHKVVNKNFKFTDKELEEENKVIDTIYLSYIDSNGNNVNSQVVYNWTFKLEGEKINKSATWSIRYLSGAELIEDNNYITIIETEEKTLSEFVKKNWLWGMPIKYYFNNKENVNCYIGEINLFSTGCIPYNKFETEEINTDDINLSYGFLPLFGKWYDIEFLENGYYDTEISYKLLLDRAFYKKYNTELLKCIFTFYPYIIQYYDDENIISTEDNNKKLSTINKLECFNSTLSPLIYSVYNKIDNKLYNNNENIIGENGEDLYTSTIYRGCDESNIYSNEFIPIVSSINQIQYTKYNDTEKHTLDIGQNIGLLKKQFKFSLYNDYYLMRDNLLFDNEEDECNFILPFNLYDWGKKENKHNIELIFTDTIKFYIQRENNKISNKFNNIIYWGNNLQLVDDRVKKINSSLRGINYNGLIVPLYLPYNEDYNNKIYNNEVLYSIKGLNLYNIVLNNIFIDLLNSSNYYTELKIPVLNKDNEFIYKTDCIRTIKDGVYTFSLSLPVSINDFKNNYTDIFYLKADFILDVEIKNNTDLKSDIIENEEIKNRFTLNSLTDLQKIEKNYNSLNYEFPTDNKTYSKTIVNINLGVINPYTKQIECILSNVDKETIQNGEIEIDTLPCYFSKSPYEVKPLKIDLYNINNTQTLNLDNVNDTIKLIQGNNYNILFDFDGVINDFKIGQKSNSYTNDIFYNVNYSYGDYNLKFPTENKTDITKYNYSNKIMGYIYNSKGEFIKESNNYLFVYGNPYSKLPTENYLSSNVFNLSEDCYKDMLDVAYFTYIPYFESEDEYNKYSPSNNILFSSLNPLKIKVELTTSNIDHIETQNFDEEKILKSIFEEKYLSIKNGLSSKNNIIESIKSFGIIGENITSTFTLEDYTIDRLYNLNDYTMYGQKCNTNNKSENIEKRTINKISYKDTTISENIKKVDKSIFNTDTKLENINILNEILGSKLNNSSIVYMVKSGVSVKDLIIQNVNNLYYVKDRANIYLYFTNSNINVYLVDEKNNSIELERTTLKDNLYKYSTEKIEKGYYYIRIKVNGDLPTFIYDNIYIETIEEEEKYLGSSDVLKNNIYNTDKIELSTPYYDNIGLLSINGYPIFSTPITYNSRNEQIQNSYLTTKSFTSTINLLLDINTIEEENKKYSYDKNTTIQYILKTLSYAVDDKNFKTNWETEYNISRYLIHYKNKLIDTEQTQINYTFDKYNLLNRIETEYKLNNVYIEDLKLSDVKINTLNIENIDTKDNVKFNCFKFKYINNRNTEDTKDLFIIYSPYIELQLNQFINFNMGYIL